MKQGLRRKFLEPAVREDLKVLARFISVYCDGRHADAKRRAVSVGPHPADEIIGRTVILCPDCGKLLEHAAVKRALCPMEPKPACKDCPEHCYHPDYRRRIREVMRYSGWMSVFKGRLDYLLKLLLPPRNDA